MQISRPYDLPNRIVVALERYADDHLEPGGFLLCALENNFADAIVRADPTWTVTRLSALALFLATEMPPESWGSPAKVAAWLNHPAAVGEVRL